RVRGQREGLRPLYVRPDAIARGNAVREEGGGDAEARALGDLIANRVDGERDPPLIAFRRAGDRIDARLQWIQRLDQGFRAGSNAGEFLQRGKHVERRRIAVRVATCRQLLRLLPPLAASEIGNQVEQHVGRGG